jgi:hypothetical protein
MLRAFAFDRLGVVVGDLYFKDPQPAKGQEGPEHGVRLELRVINRAEPKGTIYAAIPIEVAEPVWRVDLLESVDGKPGSYDRTHHHPVFTGWNPNHRVFVRDLTSDPFGWLEAQLNDLPGILAAAGFPQDAATEEDEQGLRDSAKEIAEAARTLLDRVRAGELAQPPKESADSIRNGWL